MRKASSTEAVMVASTVVQALLRFIVGLLQSAKFLREVGGAAYGTTKRSLRGLIH
jgi:hypothetical protein